MFKSIPLGLHLHVRHWFTSCLKPYRHFVVHLIDGQATKQLHIRYTLQILISKNLTKASREI